MTGVFLSAVFIGLAAVAVWLHVRYPSRRPNSLVGAVVRLAVSFVALGLLPNGLSLVLTHAPRPSQLMLSLALLFPVVTYWLLSWVWLLGRIMHDLLGGPRGGLPVGDGAH
ncbi:MAG TPA: hypothetical protein VE088_03455 [Gaiellaceae bacterium]|jgi:divalent metal cation (Fe/Co/Zn/Cd) transporter|nr:hypothetical protein [Gaiellaceae bacterium]